MADPPSYDRRMILKNSSVRSGSKNLKPTPNTRRSLASISTSAIKFPSEDSSLSSSSAISADSAVKSASAPFSPFPSVNQPAFKLALREYQRDAFNDRTNGLEVWLWGRQTGKSFTLAAWAIDRLVTRPGRLVTILSNSLANGMELNQKCAEIARLYDVAFAEEGMHAQFETMNVEIRLSIPTDAGEKVSRIKILPANPRTARGFSGDLILDEFAFHENGTAIWEAAEPILSANPDYLCRIASTPNGRHNMFYRLATDPRIPTRIVPRSLAWEQGLIIAHPITRAPITPTEARALAVDKRAYDQNYECIFEAENMSLLTRDLISQAEDPSVGLICDDTWSPEALSLLSGEWGPHAPSHVLRDASPRSSSEFAPHSHLPKTGGAMLPQSPNIAATALPSDASETSPFSSSPQSTTEDRHLESRSDQRLEGNKLEAALGTQSKMSAQRNFFVGVDVGRNRDLTVISVLEKSADLFLVRAILRLRNLRLPVQQQLLEVACRSPRFAAAQIDMTGLGLGLFEYTHQRFGDRIRGLNFASTISLPHFSSRSFSSFDNRQSKIGNIRVPEALALGLLNLYESKRIKHPIDTQLREDLRKPERITTADGRVSITASRDENGHADHFWSLALAVDAAQRAPAPMIYIPRLRNRMHIPRNKFV